MSYDPEVRWSEKRAKGWTGYQLQVSETDDSNSPYLITDIAVTPSVMHGHRALEVPADRQQQRCEAQHNAWSAAQC